MTDDRAVSEVLGYVLVIAIVTMTIGVVMVLGIGGLEDTQRSEQINNMERGFDVLAHNIDELIDRQAPTRATELRITSGSLGYGSSTTINVTVDGELVGDLTIVSAPIVYDSGTGTQIAYDTGAVIRSDNDYNTMVSEPRFIIDEDAIVIGGLRTRPVAGSVEHAAEPGTMLIRGEYLGSTTGTNTLNDGPIEISIESDYPDAWERYFEQQPVGTTSRTDETVSFEVDPDEIDTTEVHVILVRTRFAFLH